MATYNRGLSLLALLLTYNAALILASTGCPDGWVPAGFHCYKSFDEHLTWQEAEAHCQSYTNGGKDSKAHLASIVDIPENALLKGWLEITDNNVTDPWIGLQPVADNNLHDTWTDGNPADLAIWVEEGILDEEFMFMNQTCLTLTADGSWLPTECIQQRPYVCKLSICPRGWTSYGGRCYHAFTAKESWVHAEKHCQSFSKGYEAHLASIADAMENRFILTLISGKSQSMWIGMKCLKEEDQSPIWSEDEEFDLTTVSTDDAIKTKNNTCVEMHADDNEVVWQDAQCKEQLAYICKISLCRRGWTAFDGSCLWYKSETTPRKPAAATLSVAQTKGKRRVRRGFESRFSSSKFSSSKFGGFKPAAAPMANFPTAQSSSSKSTITSGSTSRTSSTTRTSNTVPQFQSAMPDLTSLPDLSPDAQLHQASDDGSDMRCLGNWSPSNTACTRYWSTPMTYNEAKRYCETFTYGGKVNTATMLENVYKGKQPFTCTMAKLYRPAKLLV